MGSCAKLFNRIPLGGGGAGGIWEHVDGLKMVRIKLYYLAFSICLYASRLIGCALSMTFCKM